MKITTEDIITALNVNGIDATSPQFYDEQEWDDYLEACMCAIDEKSVEKATKRGDSILERNDFAMEEIESQLREANII